ncbi:MAG: hypothetical protein RhofKO_11600 [Rhodothermales bacterium]
MCMRLLSLLCAVLLIAACDSADEDPTPEVTELMIEDLRVGDGPTAAVGDSVSVDYVLSFLDGRLIETNATLDGGPFNFVLGTVTHIQGWTQGMTGVREGGRRVITIPSELAYGSRGRPDVGIPGNTPIVYDVIVHSVKKGPF